MLKEVIPVYKVFTDVQAISADGGSTTGSVSTPTNLIYKDNLSFECSWTGTPTGTFTVEGSNSYNPGNVQSGGAPNSGVWRAVSLPFGRNQAVGTSGNILFDLDQCGFAWVRFRYVSSAYASQTVALVADVGGSLNNKYFLLNGGNNSNLYYVWFNINSAGTDPAIAGRTGIQVTGATNATASTLGTAMATAISTTGSADFTTSGTSTVTITNKVSGYVTPIVDGTAATGFTFALGTGSGLIQCYIAGKSLG